MSLLSRKKNNQHPNREDDFSKLKEKGITIHKITSIYRKSMKPKLMDIKDLLENISKNLEPNNKSDIRENLGLSRYNSGLTDIWEELILPEIEAIEKRSYVQETEVFTSSKLLFILSVLIEYLTKINNDDSPLNRTHKFNPAIHRLVKIRKEWLSFGTALGVDNAFVEEEVDSINLIFREKTKNALNEPDQSRVLPPSQSDKKKVEESKEILKYQKALEYLRGILSDLGIRDEKDVMLLHGQTIQQILDGNSFLQRTLNKTSDENDRLKEENETLIVERDNLIGTNRALSEENNRFQERINSLETDLDDLKIKLQANKRELSQKINNLNTILSNFGINSKEDLKLIKGIRIQQLIRTNRELASKLEGAVPRVEHDRVLEEKDRLNTKVELMIDPIEHSRVLKKLEMTNEERNKLKKDLEQQEKLYNDQQEMLAAQAEDIKRLAKRLRDADLEIFPDLDDTSNSND